MPGRPPKGIVGVGPPPTLAWWVTLVGVVAALAVLVLLTTLLPLPLCP